MGTVVKADAELVWAYAQYKWAQMPEHAIPCCIGHIHALRPMTYSTEQLARTVYLHGQWPCMFVHVIATVVGVQRNEFYAEYTLDDGSGTIDVHCRQTLPTWHEHRSGAQARDKEPGQLDHSELHFSVGDLVDTLARLHTHSYRGRVLQAVAIDRIEDRNEEPRHILRAVDQAFLCTDTLPDELVTQVPNTRAPGPKAPVVCDQRPPDMSDLRDPPPASPPAAPTFQRAQEPTCAQPIPSSSELTTRDFARRVWRYMHQDTLAQTAAAACITMKAVPLYTTADLALRFQSEAQAVISDKARRSGQPVPIGSSAMEHRIKQLLSHTVTYLTQKGSVVAWRDGVYVVCAYVLAAHLGKMLHLWPQVPGARVAKEPAMRADTLCMRLRRADPRFQYVPLGPVTEGLELLAHQGLVHPVMGSYLPMVPLQAGQKCLAKVPSS